MKNLTLITAILIFLASCTEHEVPPTTSTSDDDITYLYDSVFISTDYDGGEEMVTGAGVYNYNPEESEYTIWILKFYGSDAWQEYYKFTVPAIGNFSFDSTYTTVLGSTNDSVFITGYFDADTMYMQYYFERIDFPSYNGNVELHSF